MDGERDVLLVERGFFWSLVLVGLGAIGYLLATGGQEGGQLVAPVERGTGSSGGLNVMNAELEIQPIFLVDQRTRLPEIETFWAIGEYPLFVPGRTAMVREEPVVEPEIELEIDAPLIEDVVVRKPDIRLVGTVLKGDGRLALITDEMADFLRPLYIDDVIDGWRVARIETETLTLERDGEAMTLSILR